jgi:quercetin dioxygenase-like cupin family protein
MLIFWIFAPYLYYHFIAYCNPTATLATYYEMGRSGVGKGKERAGFVAHDHRLLKMVMVQYRIQSRLCSRALVQKALCEPHKHKSGPGSTERSTMSNEQTAPETNGVTAKLLSTVDLGPEIEGMAGRQLRMRMVTIEPGGVFGPIHDHKDRPGIVYILQGTITDHRNGVATDYGPGVGWPEDRNTKHWLENRGTITAVEISVDLFTQD